MLIRTSLFAVAVAMTAQAAGISLAQDVHYVKGEDGTTYRETRQVINQTVPETRLEERESLVYRPTYTSELKETQRAYVAPVTEYQWVPYLERSWNPFAAPVLTYRLMPQTRLETHVETVRIPVTRCEMVQEKHVVRVPVTTSRVAQGEIVTRVPVATSSPANAIVSPASSQAAAPLGGVHKFESDPPRQSSNPSTAGGPVQR